MQEPSTHDLRKCISRRGAASPDRPFVLRAAFGGVKVSDAVIAAEFGDRETDEIARDALTRHYPGREVVTLNVDPLGEMGGGIHCATQQMPAV